MGRKLVSERTVIDAAKNSKVLEVSKDAIITSAARDKAKQLGISIQIVDHSRAAKSETPSGIKVKPGGENKIAMGADHGGFPLKSILKKTVESLGFKVVDVGTHSTVSVDYPDFAHAVAQLVGDGDCVAGIMIDGAGIGSCMAANKVPGVRAAMCYDVSSAVNSREHNDANVLTLGAGLIGNTLAEHIVKVWLKTAFAGGRHQKRIDKIIAIDLKYKK